MTVGKQFEKNFAMICFLLSPSGGKRKTHFSLQNSERPFCLPTVTHSPPVSAIMALNIMYRQKKTDGNRPRLPSVSVAFLCNMLKLTIFQRKSQNIIDIYSSNMIGILKLTNTNRAKNIFQKILKAQLYRLQHFSLTYKWGK